MRESLNICLIYRIVLLITLLYGHFHTVEREQAEAWDLKLYLFAMLEEHPRPRLKEWLLRWSNLFGNQLLGRSGKDLARLRSSNWVLSGIVWASGHVVGLRAETLAYGVICEVHRLSYVLTPVVPAGGCARVWYLIFQSLSTPQLSVPLHGLLDTRRVEISYLAEG